MPTFHPEALAGQHIVISGGVGALGLAIVNGLVSHGAKVTVNDIIPKADGIARLVEAGISEDAVYYVQADLTQEDAVQHLVEAARERFGVITTTLCHAGMVKATPLIDYSLDEWRKLQDINVTAAFMLAKASANAMLADDVNGHIVFTISWVADVPWPDIGPYSASKAALKMLTRSFARELADKHIRVNAVAPGIVGAGMAKKQWDTEPDYRARAEKAIPLGFLQPLSSVADSFVYLCSPAASYMTGSVLLVDGGCSLYPMD